MMRQCHISNYVACACRVHKECTFIGLSSLWQTEHSCQSNLLRNNCASYTSIALYVDRSRTGPLAQGFNVLSMESDIAYFKLGVCLKDPMASASIDEDLACMAEDDSVDIGFCYFRSSNATVNFMQKVVVQMFSISPFAEAVGNMVLVKTDWSDIAVLMQGGASYYPKVTCAYINRQHEGSCKAVTGADRPSRRRAFLRKER